MRSPAVALPEISISPAPPSELPQEPYSPFADSHPHNLKEPDSPRPTLLSPPPTATPHLHRQLSPLRPEDVPAGRGIERERFEALLRASRERNAAVGAKRSPDLRKEIAVKAHRSKQMERRALFLTKLHAPPSPSATLVPKTPPESPAIFHYSLPSPGLESPLTVFEMLSLEDPMYEHNPTWVEQVDFRVPGLQYAKKRTVSQKAMPTKKGALPSLDQITARLSFTPQGAGAPLESPQAPQPSPRLPAFLRSASKPVPAAPVQAEVKIRRALPAVGRLQFPTKPRAEEAPEMIVSPSPRLPPASPSSPVSPKLQVTTTLVARTSSRSPDALTESNLNAFVIESRERMAKDMLGRLRRRTLTPSQGLVASEERKLRRHSAPPELSINNRVGFCTPVLDLPGAF
ncbi:hypothetical protein EUX98_g2183 [Antrodiella citrinella]|uniref:Uncharacterized protein n=1 Tax=Antrodiella citrinella TaxID=2447956 RepID=A0A4S4MZN9_9APHY|nr:hypothetical protein EUX98_g2183 [Antrodiella citrinella]